MRLPVKHVVYHSQEWEDLVEQGWFTSHIEWIDGKHLAVMMPIERSS